MRVSLPVIGAFGLLLAAACGGSSRPEATVPAGSTAAATATLAAAPPTAPAGGAPTPAGTMVEVTGIVGTVSTATRLIEIDRLSGAEVRRIAVSASTVIRVATGGTATLSQIRPSDRIIARGAVNDRGDTLEAVEVTVQAVVPGAAPGG